MSLINPIDLRKHNLREVVAAFISGKINRLEFSEAINLKIRRDGEKATLTITDGTVEVDLPGPIDPDVIKITAFYDHAVVELRLTNLRVDY
jgi:hypothetical protein